MHSTRTAVLAMLVALLLPAPAMLAETAPPDRSKTADPVSAELAKKCRALAIKAHPKAAGSGPYAQVQRDYYQDCIAKGGICRTEPRSMSAAATAVPVATIAQIPITQLAHANGLRCWACACLRRSRHAIPIR
jgi:hypothetical protein